MAEFTFQQLMRTGHVKRWQIVRVAREQTIAEHMYRVWLITTQICYALKTPQEISTRASLWALYHDVPEVVTGDIATPAKEAMRSHVPADDPIRNIELALSDTYKNAWKEAKTQVVLGWPTPYEIVKLADMLEARCFLGCEMVGNHAKEVFDGICQRIDDLVAFLETTYREPVWASIDQILIDSWSKT